MIARAALVVVTVCLMLSAALLAQMIPTDPHD